MISLAADQSGYYFPIAAHVTHQVHTDTDIQTENKIDKQIDT